MKIKRLAFTMLVLVLLMSACAPAARQQDTAADGGESAPAEQAPASPAPTMELQSREEAPVEEEFAEAEAEAPLAADSAGAPEPLEDGFIAPGEQVQQPSEGQPPVDMFFEDYGTNPFVPTEQDNLSTFAIDVDTGAYTLTRSYLRDGVLPPAEAIRAEEFINYFDYDYPAPTQQDGFAIHMDAAPTPFSSQDAYVLRVGVQGYEVADEDRPDANLIFVIDISGSMSGGNRLDAVKVALESLVKSLRPTDTVAIVVYGSNGRVLLNPTDVSDSTKIVNAINRLQTDGSTNAEEGLNLAYQLATSSFDPERINRIILCSDGVANVGPTGPDAILESVRQQAREGITLSTVGFGMGNYNDVLMEQLANDGDGQYFYVDTQQEAERIFVENLTGTLLTIGRDAKIQVDFNPAAVEAYRLIGYENRDVADEDFRNDDVDAGEIGAGHSVTALYELIPVEGAQGTVATAYLRWEDPETGNVTEIEQPFDGASVADSFEDADINFQLAVTVAGFAEVLGEGGWSQSATLAAVYDMAALLSDTLQGSNADIVELIGMIDTAYSLQ